MKISSNLNSALQSAFDDLPSELVLVSLSSSGELRFMGSDSASGGYPWWSNSLRDAKVFKSADAMAAYTKYDLFTKDQVFAVEVRYLLCSVLG